MKTFIKTVNTINRTMMWIVGSIILFMGLALFYAVVMRYFFDQPQIWSFDLVSWFTGMAAFLGGGYALLKGAHVKVDVFYEKFSLKTQSLMDVFTSVFLFLIVIVLVWKGWEQVIHNYKLGVIANTGLNIFVWIKWTMVPLGGMLLGLQALVNLINDLFIVVKGEKLWKEES